jgi:ABC-type ATPase involved in cell division
MSLMKKIFGVRKPTFGEFEFTKRLILSSKMKEIQTFYREVGSFCYELYTLMYAFALKENIPYGLDIHLKLMDIVEEEYGAN